MLIQIFFVFLIQLSIGFNVQAESRTNFDVKQQTKCPTNSSTLQYSFNITKENHQHYLDFYLNSPFPLDDNVGINVIIETSINGKTFLPLFTVREKDFCKAMNKYLGELWYDMERAAQIPPGVCPINAGIYRVHHMVLHFEKITLQTFPFGTLRFTMRAIDKRHKTIVFCEIMVVENVLN